MDDSNQVQYHVRVKTGEVGRYVLLPGDPGRVEKIAAFLDHPHFVSSNREHTVWSGSLLGERVSVVSTGMGCPSTAIAVEELIKAGADTFIRVGTAGAMQPDIQVGEVVIVTGAIRDEGTTRQYLPVEYPAIADHGVVNALEAAANSLGVPNRLGVSHTKDSFYGEIEPDRMPVADELKTRWKAWIAGGAVSSEMEAAAIFILGSIYRKRAGAVLTIIGSDTATLKAERASTEPMMRVAIEAVKRLIQQDRQ